MIIKSPHLGILELLAQKFARYAASSPYEDTRAKHATTRSLSHKAHYQDIHEILGDNLDSMFIALLAASERLKNEPIANLIESYANRSSSYKIPDDLNGFRLTVSTVTFKSDTLGLDVFPEEEIVRFLFSPNSYPDDLVRRYHIANSPKTVFAIAPAIFDQRSQKPLRALISEEFGIVPRTSRLDETVDIFIADPLCGSHLLKKILTDTDFEGHSLEDRLHSYSLSNPDLIVPSMGIAYFDEGKIGGNAVLDLMRNIYYIISNNGAFKFKLSLSWNNGDLDLCIPKLEAVRFRDFADCDMNKYLCHCAPGVYADNLAYLRLDRFNRYDLKGIPGQLRPLFFTTESRYKPRFIVYNGEKMTEWIGALAWAKYSGRFNIYLISNPDCPHRGGFPMAPTQEDCIFSSSFLKTMGLICNRRKEGFRNDTATLRFYNIENKPLPSQHRVTLALVYKEDRELNRHFTKIGSQLYL